MKALLALVVFVILFCITAVATKTDSVNPCKRQPFRGRCPFTKGKSPTRSQFVLRYYLRDKECVSYPFGHCADDENEPILYRYKEECEKACLNESNNSDTATENAHMIEKSTSSLSNKITDSDTDIGTSTEKQVSTTSEPFFENTHTISSQRAAFAVQKDTPHKLLTECERRRQASESGLIKSDFIPICTADGSFRPLQCVTKGEKCFCVDHNGIKIPNSEFNGTMKPNCKQIIKVQKPLINECLSAVDSGPCSAAFARWYYDDSEQQCVQFEYSGCGGNGNNYLTRVECEKQCKPAAYNKAKCKDGLEPLRNESGQLVNCKESACPDGYLCSIAQLGSTCCPISTSSNVASDICQLPKERGPCDQFELRFYYNNRLDECKYFFFGGCEGNANNFERVEECERICRQRGAKVSAVSIVSAPQLITSGPQMRKLSKEFGTKTVKKTKSEENELVELISSVTSDRDDNISSISDVIENIDADASTNEAISEITEIDTSSATVPHDRPTTSKDLSATNTDQSKLHLSQKINEDVHKSRQKETKTPLNSSNIDIITDFTTLEHETTISTFDNSEKFIASNNESNRNAKISNESVAVTGQQLSNRKQVKMFSSTSEITTTRHPSTTTGREERLSNKSKPSSTTPPSTTPSSTTPPSTTPSSTTPSSTSSISLSSSTTVTSRLTTSSATESSVPQPTESSDRCFQKLDRGTCTGQFLRWHWDSERNTCQVFTYSGCGGNGNNFRNREDCFAACHKPPQPISNIGNVCEHSIHPGDCTGVFQRFAFDSTIGDCRPFTYTGCGGNGNNFGSSLECRNKCTTHRPTLSTNICEHPIEVGECSGVFPRFAYDLAANECRPFTYGGCGGNGNNFGSIAECKETCIQGQPNVSVQCPAVDVSLCVEPCILFSNRRGCHECTCPVAHSASTSSATTSGTSPIDESKALEAEQFIQNKVQKKDESTAHPEKISPTNSVAELGEKCSQPMDAGPCKNFIERWFFDIESGLCQSFQYGGCAGNRNHFFSKYECEIHCARFFNRRTGRRRIVAYQNALHARHDTIEQLQSAEILNESEYEDITDNQESPAYRSSLNDLPSPMKANSWKHVAESDPENGRYAGVKLEGDTELNGLHSLQHGSGIAMQNEHLDAMISQNFAKSSAREQQPWSVSLEHKVDILVPDSNTQHQTIVDDDKQISTEATKQQDVHRQQIDDKTVFSKVQNDASQMISNASKSEIIPVQKVKMDTHMKSTCKDVSTSMNLSEWNRENSALQQNQSQSTTQKINVLQIQQQNGLLQQILPQQQILRHDTQYEKIENITSLISNLLDSQIANQTFIDYTTTQNSKTSSDEQITGMITNDREKELKKRIENTIINKALISNSIFDNLVSDGYKIPIDQNGGRLISDEIATSMNSFSPRFEAKNEIHMQVNSVNEPLKKHNRSAEVTNGSSSRKISSQFINTQLPHKEYDNAVTVAKDTVLRQSNRDSVLRHHVRIINRGSVLQAFSSLSPLSSNSPPLLLTSSLPTLSPTISSPSSSTTPPLILSSSTSLLSSSLSSPLIPSEAHLNIFEEMSHRSIPDKNESFNGARGTHLKHAIDGGIVPSNTEEFSHGSAAMHINTREHKGQEFIALNSENEVTLPATLNDFDIITDSINDNAIITTRKKPDLSPIIPKEWNMDPDGHKIVDKIDTILQNSLPDEFLMSTIIPTTTSSGETAQSVLENAAPSLASVSITLNNTHSAPTSVSSMKSINHITFSSNTAIPTNNNITSASKMIAIADNRIEGSLEPSIPSSMGILSQPIPSGKSWLYDGLQSTMNSKVFPEQYSQQELAEKKLSFGSFESAGTFPLETFKTAINNNNNLLLATTMMNTSKIPPMRTGNLMTELTSIQNLSPNAALNAAMDTTISSVELQTEKSVGQLGKSMKESEENYFNADSSIFMDAPNFQNQTLAILSLERIRNSNINTITEEPEFISNDTREAKKERSEGKTEMIGLSSSVHDFNNMSVKPKNEILHHSVTTIPRASAEIPASFAPSNSQTDILPHEDYRVNIVEGHNLHSLKHQELQRSPMENLDKIASQQSTAAHDIQMAQNIPLQTTIKQGETDDVERDETTVNVHQEKMESEIFNQQNISDSQITPETTPHAVVHGVTSLQQLQPEEDDTCVLPPDAGICRDYIPRWFYNSQTGKCEQFSYGSCGGNSNNFLDRQACEAKCSRDDSIKSQLPERCTYKKDEGYSNGYNVKWYYNVRNLRCEQMVYQGQGGNSNQFETFAECQTFCTPSDGKTTKQIAHPLKINSTGHPQSDFAASRNQENQTQTVSITGTDKISENHAYNISHNTAENPHHRIIPNNGSVGDKEIQQFSSKQHPTASSISSRSPIPTRSAQFSHSLDTSTNETIIVAEPSPDPSPPTNAMNESSDEVMERKFDSAKIFGETIVNKDNDVLVDLPSIFDGINHMPNCPNGLKPIQHADGRPVMCLPGRNQCSGNSVCYFNGVDFLCCPNTKDPYDEHIFGGYNGEEVKQGYKNVKKTPIKSNELIVRKLRLKRQTQVFTSRSSAARIDSKVQRSLSRASLAVNSSDGRQVDNICMQDANTGNCTEAHLRFFYDRRASTCRLFYYSGCGGNENNFVTEDECRRRCKSDNSHIDDAPLGSCPFGELPFGDNAPVICGKDAGSFECPKGYYCLTGPPNVCCLEKFLPGSEKILVTKKNQKNIRFSPQQSRRNADYLPEETQRESEEKSPMLLVPENICPDGSDALLDESTQQPLKCGVGYDGESFCPLGYYCSIDSERNGRLCCQLGIIGVKIPPPPRVPPYFGLRPSNPGEVISRGSLPSDYISQKQHETGILNIAKPSEGYSSRLAVKRLGDSHKIGKETTDSYGNFVPSDEATDSFENLTPSGSSSDSKLEGEIYGRMMLNSNDRIFRTQALYNSMNNADSPEAETNEVQIDVGEIKDPFESLEYAQKTTSDRSICLLKPNEGRICREDESPPRTNLQYFYSNRDKRCKLYFYRGCGGSQNRFDTKRHCELTCAGV